MVNIVKHNGSHRAENGGQRPTLPILRTLTFASDGTYTKRVRCTPHNLIDGK